jgi:hypothetical protein
MASGSEESSFSDDFLDALLPEELGWKRLVVAYPLASLGVAAAAGFWLARKSGAMIVEAVSDSASERVTGLVGEVLGEDRR